MLGSIDADDDFLDARMRCCQFISSGETVSVLCVEVGRLCLSPRELFLLEVASGDVSHPHKSC
jgi:hypothetical protein